MARTLPVSQTCPSPARWAACPGTGEGKGSGRTKIGGPLRALGTSCTPLLSLALECVLSVPHGVRLSSDLSLAR